ncbi:TlpA family protein disulfide reductase [Nocardioides sp. SYSU DS0663]|uniref:TlpA family protein disulfide reductase n=1 Tax=Nocardioides sp. SYSU DS0663 TaxID=3416445 RepID=UPI003F4C3AD4
MRRPVTAVRRVVAAVVVVLALGPSLGGCTSVEGTGEKGYVSATGQVQVLDAADRGEPVELTGTDLDGEPLDLADLRGRPTVVSVWGSWCVECIAEQDAVNEAQAELGDRAHFVGIDIRDNPANARAYEDDFDVAYPSFDDTSGTSILAFPGTLTPQTVPAFVILDEEGRVAGSILGKLPSTQTLVDLVDEVAAGSPDDDGGTADG